MLELSYPLLSQWHQSTLSATKIARKYNVSSFKINNYVNIVTCIYIFDNNQDFSFGKLFKITIKYLNLGELSQ